MRSSTVVAVVLAALIGTTASGGHAQSTTFLAGERFVLSGVMFFEDEPGLAWLQEPNLTGNRVVAVRPGESVGPYRLTRILADRVELQGPAGTVLVPIYNVHGAPGTAVAAAVPGVAAAGAPGLGRSASADGAPSPQSAASPKADTAAAKAWLDRVEAAKKRWEQSEQQRVESENGRIEPAKSPERRSAGQAKASASTTAGQAKASASTPELSTSDVVYPDRRQTFQGILGLH